MKKNFLGVVIGVALFFSVTAGFIKLTYVNATEKALQNVQVTETLENEKHKVNRSKETLEEFIERARVFDGTQSIEDYGFIEYKDLILKNLDKYYKEKGIVISSEDLELNTKIYWLTYVEDDYNFTNIKVILEKLQIKYEDMPYIMEGILTPDGMEYFRAAFYTMTFDDSMLITQDDKNYYNYIREFIEEDAPENFTEDDIKAATNFGWAMITLDMTKYTTDELIEIIKGFGMNLDYLAYYRVLNLNKPLEEIVKQIYELLLLRQVDGDGLKYWTNFLNQSNGSFEALDKLTDDMIEKIESGEEYKALLKKFE